MRRIARRGFTGISVVVLLSFAMPAIAHHTSLHARLVPVSGSSPILLSGPGDIDFLVTGGGQLRFVLSGAKGSTGTAPGNTLELDLVINGHDETRSVNFDIKSGRARGTLPLGLVSPDLVEVKRVALIDKDLNQFGTMGLTFPGPSLSSALIQVLDTLSDLRLAPTRDADVELKSTKGGVLTVRLDNVTPAPRTGNKVELEIALNGTLLTSFEFPFNIDSHGVAKVEGHLNLGLQTQDVIEVRRIDLLDSNGDRFATLGIRILNP